VPRKEYMMLNYRLVSATILIGVAAAFIGCREGTPSPEQPAVTLSAKQKESAEKAPLIIQAVIDRTDPNIPDNKGSLINYKEMRLKVERVLKGEMQAEYVHLSSMSIPSSVAEDYGVGRENIYFLQNIEKKAQGIFARPKTVIRMVKSTDTDRYADAIVEYLKQ
jgi:hypothetical protein